MKRLLLSAGPIAVIVSLSSRACVAFSVAGFYLSRSGLTPCEAGAGVTARSGHDARRRVRKSVGRGSWNGQAATWLSSAVSNAEPDENPADDTSSDVSPASTTVDSDSVDDAGGVSTASPSEESLPDIIEILGIRFEHWKTDYAHGRKRVLLYLPGIDGRGISATSQLPGLSQEFDIFRMVIGPEDRSTFLTLSRAVSGFADTVCEGTSDKMVVIGESFGGMLSLRLGQLRPDKLQCVFAVNPATSFGRTPWRSLGPLLTLVPTEPYKLVGLAALIATTPDSRQVMNVADKVNASKLGDKPRVLGESLGAIVKSLSGVADNVPPETLRWRIQNWLSAGAGRVEKDLRNMKVPVTILAGSQDRLLPSLEEARRLENLIPVCRTVVLEDRGHAPLYDSGVNLVEIITSSLTADNGTDNGRKSHQSMASGKFSKDWVEDFVMPDEVTLGEVKKDMDLVSKSLSPVIFSTREDGTSVSGLSAIPAPNRSRPIIFVGNHQLMGLDLGIIMERVWSETGIFPRGLTHPGVFLGANSSPRPGGGGDGLGQQVGGQTGQGSRLEGSVTRLEDDGDSARFMEFLKGLREYLVKFGAVPVTPRNIYRLLQRGDNVLLFPGGVTEVYHKKGEDYRLFWPERAEFVRQAAKFDALIIPFSAVGMADSFDILLNSDELNELPIVGERVRKLGSLIVSPRGEDYREPFLPPLVLPKLPSRLYVRFGQPISLEGVNKKDRVKCQEIYESVKGEVEFGISSLLRARESDPYKDPTRRFLYESVTRQSAPSFGAPELDAAVARARLAFDAKHRDRRRR